MRQFELALRERVDSRPTGLAGTRAPVCAVAELSQLELGLETESYGTGRVERCNGAFELHDRTVMLTGQGQRTAGQCSRATTPRRRIVPMPRPTCP
jgi:hypothetical protein